ncbi:zinc finger protein 346-like [Ctenocephalides felis]|uniref:zinc finger protein 346-like n=1 Tax=Ctenocephalides felis TaxID=7515 RepID=UPI000E6E5871|nr:zinc finger protein 346-like [Ctenocephalides felis]XP_026464174.1 zinc finger protein 346-like [Ctenocephalides felis]XP_026464175.1 zinc finger protein 346-like [Ctenocephalides felis]
MANLKPLENTESEAQPVAEKINEKLPCDICKLTFANSCILESHLAGKRHQKNLRSQSLGGLPKETFDGTTTGLTVIGQFYCKDCGIYANSSSQLDMHMKSNKHISKVEQKALENTTPAPTQKAIKKKSKDADNTDASPSKKAKPDGQPEIFKCESCNVETNSKTQYEQHMMSNRHKNRLNPQYGGSADGISSRKRKGAAFMARKRQSRFGLGYDQPLSSSFVSGGSYETPQQPQQPQQPSNMSLLYGRAKQYSAAMMSYQQQQGAYKGMKQNEYGYGTEMPTAAVNGSKMDNEAYRNTYGRPNAMAGIAQGGYNNMAAKKPYYTEDPYANYGQMANQNMNAQYGVPTMGYNNATMKSSFSLW